MLIASLAALAFAAVVIMYGCNSFEDAADYLGRNMKPGVKGATINAIGSSLPELFTTTILLFGPLWAPEMFGSREDGFSAGIATCAGSAVFNAVIIPALCIIAVMFWGVKTGSGPRTRVTGVQLDKKLVIKDGIFFVLAEIALIIFLADAVMVWWMGAVLVGLYLVYATVTLVGGFEDGGDEDDDDDDDDDDDGGVGILGLAWLLDFNARFFKGAPFTQSSAWIVLAVSVGVIGVACGGIAWSVEHSARALGVEPYFTAVILAAAATSVPDTVLSVKDAMKGEYDDAVANAVGSNIFDITICLGLPLLAYGLVVGDVHLAASGVSADVQSLRWALLAVTALVLALFLFGSTIGRFKAVALFSIYIVWSAFVVGRASDAGWANAVIEFFPGHAAESSIEPDGAAGAMEGSVIEGSAITPGDIE